MSSKKIYHISDLPEWFSLENYKATEGFNGLDWGYFLHRRLFVQDRLNPSYASKPNPDQAKTMFSDMLQDNSGMSKDSVEEESSRSKAKRDMDRESKEDELCHNPGFNGGFSTGWDGSIAHMTSGWAF